MRKYGVIVVYKEKGYTSHDVAAVVRKILRGAKTGHTGTLDPQAEGVLPVCFGRATKLAGLLTANDKSYTAEVLLGVTTDTCDITGRVLREKPVAFDEAAIAEAVGAFTGEVEQIPPMYSAIKQNGQPLYKLARSGVEVERAPRRVRIDRAEAVSYMPERNAFIIEVDCSKGTYIRCLCQDIGEKLGCGACMGELTRTRSGMFELKDAVKLGALKQAAENGRLDDYILPVESVLPLTKAVLKPEGVKPALNGNPVPFEYVRPFDGNGVFNINRGERVWLYDENDGYDEYNEKRLVGLFLAGGALTVEIMLAGE